ncbi:MAG: CsbD family protein [Acetobacteraceae bacterium]|nr:CsbD family protein [Acetobacteraceae bacterium]
MNKDRVIGAGKQMLGAVKKAAAELAGDAKSRADGKAEQLKGKIQKAAGSLKDALKGQ